MGSAGKERPYDVVVLGATGFTGGLVCEYLAERYASGGTLRFAIAGRNEAKLRDARANAARYNADWKNVDIIVADSSNAADMDAVASKTRVVLSTVGPYVRYGDALVDACVRHGTHYCDITGEVQWVRSVIDRHHETAAAKGVKIVHFCGFDSVPSDIGTFVVAEHFKTVIGHPPTRVKAVFGKMRGGVSGATLESMRLFMKDAKRVMRDPQFLNPADCRQARDPADRVGLRYEPDVRAWTIPFFMAACNVRVVRRSIALAGDTYSYDEMWSPRGGFFGALLFYIGLVCMLVFMRLTRPIAHLIAPAPGTGPSRHAMETGMFETRVYGFGPSTNNEERVVCCKIVGKGDPGYRLASRMLAEAAVCMALKEDQQWSTKGGVLTPASALGTPYVERLNNAGIVFAIQQS